MKYALCITQVCNLACGYRYIGKRKCRMSLAIARKIIDFAFENTPDNEDINIGFFGGEPLTEVEPYLPCKVLPISIGSQWSC